MQENPLTLFELNNQIKNLVYENLRETFWVKAEISDIKENSNGHCYLELIEKTNDSENITARSRATIWSFTYRILKPYFETTAGRRLEQGLKILINVSVDYHEIYGLSLNVKDIEPSFTIGDLQLQRLKVIKQLTDDGVIEMNKQLTFPVVPQKIAVISSSTAAGYEDFINQLENNSHNYKFYYKLFEASMQGSNTEESIINALDKIICHEDIFDIVVIIRGGGSKSDLSCFDSYWLSFNLAQFPLPIITGIGHERDNCVVDIVAHAKLKTPTAVAEFIISKTHDFENNLNEIVNYLDENIYEKITWQSNEIDTLSYKLLPVVNQSINKFNNSLVTYKTKIETQCQKKLHLHEQNMNGKKSTLFNKTKIDSVYLNNNVEKIEKSVYNLAYQFVNNHSHKMELIENAVNLINPVNILKRGYSITFLKGKVVKNHNDIKAGDKINTKLIDCTFESLITDIKNVN
jgi:exodeoxyribonuclease VII large subunit